MWVEHVNALGDLEGKFRAFGWHVSHINGHNVSALERTFRALDGITDRPKAVIADTVKGRGVSFMEGPAMKPGARYDYHSGAPNEDDYARASAELVGHARRLFDDLGLGPLQIGTGHRPPRKQPKTVERLVSAYTQALVEEARRNPAIIVLDADLVKDCGLVPFAQEFPDRFVECGIAEQDMVSVACGMARRGALPIAHSFACFLAARPNEQIYNQCSESSKVIYVGSLAGLLPGGPGHSHQSVRDLSALGSVPNLILAEPCTEAEVKALVHFLVNRTSESSYLRLVSLGWPVPFALPADYGVELGRGTVVREGRDAVMFGYGPWLLANACEAAELVQQTTGVAMRVVNLPWLNRVDPSWLKETIGDRRLVVTLDNHYVHGGQGEMLAAAMAELALEPSPRVVRIGVTELPECGTNEEVLAYHGLDVAGLVKRLTQVVPQVA
jgi:transketolase